MPYPDELVRSLPGAPGRARDRASVAAAARRAGGEELPVRSAGANSRAEARGAQDRHTAAAVVPVPQHRQPERPGMYVHWSLAGEAFWPSREQVFSIILVSLY